MKAVENILKKAWANLQKAEQVLSQLKFDHKDMELVNIDKKYEWLKKQG